MQDLVEARTASGRRVWPLALVAACVGTALILGLVALLGDGDQSSHLMIAMAPAAFVTSGLLGWVAFTDRRSIPGAVECPEESVEDRWYDNAVRGSFHDLLIVMGLLAFALNVWPDARSVSAAWVVPGVLVCAALDVFVRYQVQSRA